MHKPPTLWALQLGHATLFPPACWEGEAEGEQSKPGWDASSAMPPGDLPEQAASLGDPPEFSWRFFPSVKSRHLGREAASSWQSHHAYRGQKITGRTQRQTTQASTEQKQEE